MILDLQFNTKEISRKRIRDRFVLLAERHLVNEHLYEVIWLIYTLRGLKTPLHSKIVSELIGSTNSSALALVLLDMQNRGLYPSKLPKDNWAKEITKDKITTDWSWLLAYEGIRHGWLIDPHELMKHPFFKSLVSRDIIFYDERRNIPKLSSIVKLRKRGRRGRMREVFRLMQQMRGSPSIVR